MQARDKKNVKMLSKQIYLNLEYRLHIKAACEGSLITITNILTWCAFVVYKIFYNGTYN